MAISITARKAGNPERVQAEGHPSAVFPPRASRPRTGAGTAAPQGRRKPEQQPTRPGDWAHRAGRQDGAERRKPARRQAQKRHTPGGGFSRYPRTEPISTLKPEGRRLLRGLISGRSGDILLPRRVSSNLISI